MHLPKTQSPDQPSTVTIRNRRNVWFPNPSRHTDNMLKFNIIYAVWGDAYIDVMVRVAIPTMLFDGNLPALAERHRCKVVFFIRGSEEERIRAAPSIVKLAGVATLEFHHFDPDAAPNMYMAMSEAHYRAGLAAKDEGALVIVGCPDAVYSNGTFAALGKYAEQGKVAVMCPGPRLVQETALPVLAEIVDGGSISGRELVALTLEHIHPETARHFVDSPDFCTFPTFCMWPMGTDGMLIRSFHLHPLMIDLSRLDSLDSLKEQTIDGALLGRALGDWTDLHVETDTDNICLCTLAPRSVSNFESRHEPFDIELVRKSAHSRVVNELHRFFFTKSLLLHTRDLDERWEEIESSTSWILDAIKVPPKPEVKPSEVETRGMLPLQIHKLWNWLPGLLEKCRAAISNKR